MTTIQQTDRQLNVEYEHDGVPYIVTLSTTERDLSKLVLQPEAITGLKAYFDTLGRSIQRVTVCESIESEIFGT
jgi:hypothetical protein